MSPAVVLVSRYRSSILERTTEVKPVCEEGRGGEGSRGGGRGGEGSRGGGRGGEGEGRGGEEGRRGGGGGGREMMLELVYLRTSCIERSVTVTAYFTHS